MTHRVTDRMLRSVSEVVPQCAPVRVQQRARVQSELANAGIASTVYYPVPIHLQPIYASLNYRSGDLPETEKASGEVLSLPMYPELNTEQIQLIAQAIGSALRG